MRPCSAEPSFPNKDLNMRWRNSTAGYGAALQIMHWSTVILVIVAWFLGQLDDLFPNGAARAASLFVHISAGLAVIGMLVSHRAGEQPINASGEPGWIVFSSIGITGPHRHLRASARVERSFSRSMQPYGSFVEVKAGDFARG
jgi:hypothetical protein